MCYILKIVGIEGPFNRKEVVHDEGVSFCEFVDGFVLIVEGE